MYLSDRDLAWAVKTGKLIVDPRPADYGPTSIDLHLDRLQEAKIWDMEKYREHEKARGRPRAELCIGEYNLGTFSREYLRVAPDYDGKDSQLVARRGNEIVVKPLGFLLWQTKEEVGTQRENADFICFVDGKSTKARAGIVVHLTAPTIHAAWKGRITLEIVNLGPFDLVFKENDVVAQLTVAKVTSPPERDVRAESATYDQITVHGAPKDARKASKPRAAKAAK